MKATNKSLFSDLLVVWLLTAVPSCFGQGARGLVTGVVTDASGGMIPGASVRAVNRASNVATPTHTNGDGNYAIDFLPPGEYTIAVEKQGFKIFEQTVLVRADDRLVLNPRLEIGALTEKVVIDASAPILDAGGGSLGTVMDNQRIQELPSFAGNPFMLEFLTAGIVFSGTSAFPNQRPFDSTAGVGSVNGSLTYSTTFQLDGVPDTVGRSSAYTPSVEFIQEYKVQTATYDASAGHSSGGWVDVALKSGTNQFHGAAYYYLQNPALNSNLFFNNKAGQPKPAYLFNREGGDIGGPIRRNHTFFFVGYERIRENTPEPATYTVPTAAEHAGDFSALLRLGSQYQIYDPATTTPAANGRYTREPFPGNVIPANRISSIGQKVANYYPLPNQAGAPDGTNNFLFGSGMEPDHYYSVATRLDHSINDRQRLFGRVVVSRRFDGPYRNWAPGASGNNLYYKNRGAAFDYLYTVNPHTVVDVRYGYTRFTSVHLLSTAGFDITTLGLPASLKQLMAPAAFFPDINPSGYSALDTENGGDGTFSDIHSINGTVSRTIGKHLLRTGVDFREYLVNAHTTGYATGQYNFGGFLNGPIDNSPASPIGQGMAGLLLGILGSGNAVRNDSSASRTSYTGLFLQDDWKVTSKLTLNLGVRYEYEGPIIERYNRSVSGFDFNTTSPIAAQAMANYARAPIPQIAPSQFVVKGGLTYAGVNGQPSGLYNAPKLDFAPRVGFAYSLNKSTVLRGGYGIFFDQLGITTQSPIQTGYSQTTNIVPTLDNGVTFAATLANPFPNGLLQPVGNTLGLSTFLGNSISAFNKNPQTPYNQRWSIGVQHQLHANLVLEVSYVGSRGTHLLSGSSAASSIVGQAFDGIPKQYLSPLLVRDQATINQLTQTVSNPFYPLLPGTSLSSPTVSLSQLLLPYPQFTGLTVATNAGFNWYHSLQTQVQRRFSKGFTIMGSWTWSKDMEAVQFLNPADVTPSRVISPNDRTNRVAINGIYELPFGPGRMFAAGQKGIMGKLIGGWQIEAIYQHQTGDPLGFGNFIFNGDPTKIALPISQRTPSAWFNTAGFDRATADQLLDNIVYQPLRFSGVRADGISYTDLSLVKKTKINERISADIRAEAFNSLNHTVFLDPTTTPTSAAFGQVTTSMNYPRTIQFGLVIRF